MTAQPYTPEELEQVRQRIMSVPRHKIQIARNDVLRLLATLAERDGLLRTCDSALASNTEAMKEAEMIIIDLRAQLSASHNAALERAAELCDEHEKALQGNLQRNPSSFQAEFWRTESDLAEALATRIRALMTKE